MKIVIVGQYYWPESFTINEIAEDLVKRGHVVKVLTGLPDYATNHIPKEYKRGKRRHEVHNGVEIFRVPIIARHNGVFFRVLNYISFFVTSSVFARKNKKQLSCDIIFAYQTAPVLMGNAAIVLKKILKKPLFFYCMDIWPDQMKVWNIYENNILFKIMKRYCKYAYGSGDVLAVSSQPFIDYMVRVNKVDKKRIIYIPNHYDKILNNNIGNPINKTRIDMIYAGNIGQQQNLECLLKAIRKSSTKKEFMVHIYGDGNSFSICKELVQELHIENKVTFYGRVPKEELNNIYPFMDAFLLTLCSEKQIGYVANTVPSRLQGYMTVGKPIIASIDGGANRIINEVGCGIAVPADDSYALAAALDDFIENNEKYRECGIKAKRYFDDNFERSVVINRMEQILTSLVSN